MNASRSELHIVMFNTHASSQQTKVALPRAWRNARLTAAEAYVADDVSERFRLDSEDQPWRIVDIPRARSVGGSAEAELPALSVCRLVVTRGSAN